MKFDNISREIEYYANLPVCFCDFMENLSGLADGELSLVCTDKNPAVHDKKWVPSYGFAVMVGGESVGRVNLRIGYSEGLYYGGQVGYWIDEAHWGKGYAGRGVVLLASVAKFHGMEKLLVCNDVNNKASIRVCEKLGLRLVRTVETPEWHDLYQRLGQRQTNIWEWDLNNE
ncbi:MAG: GNAT family N-acetyltransferase [Defluviitaleaceae bacterium]|nr:GNAT family N-acetyltransferase [Defluviitaleaceae bacterium]